MRRHAMRWRWHAIRGHTVRWHSLRWWRGLRRLPRRQLPAGWHGVTGRRGLAVRPRLARR
ncbi:hypothetical protein [Rugosimonospora africana]|nr:hypothetical protein [Rugosimonospora africana]